MRRVAIVSNNAFANKIIEDIKLKEALEEKNIHADIISWEDPTVNYKNYNCLILRSVWGYQDNYDRFIEWLEFLKRNGITIFNSVDIISNNIRKDVQFNILDRNGIPHIPTTFIKGSFDSSLLKDNSVVKPIISGSGKNTFKGNEVNSSIINRILQERDNGLMVQPYIESIENGEYSIVYIDGENTHSMIRTPGIFTEKKKPYQIFEVPEKVLELSESVRMISEYKEALYMRVDIVDSDNPMVMEVELAEPDLLTRNLGNDEPIRKFAKAIERRIK